MDPENPLSQQLDLPVVHMDELWFTGSNWETSNFSAFNCLLFQYFLIFQTDPRNEVEERLAAWVASNAERGWVFDGNNKSSGLLSRADVVIFLDLPFTTYYPRLMRRTFWRVVTKEKLYGNNLETYVVNHFC